MTTCEHGHPQPLRCALCRRREDMRAHPERYVRPQQTAPRTTTGRPVWFELIVQDTAGMDEHEAEQYVSAFVEQLRTLPRLDVQP